MSEIVPLELAQDIIAGDPNLVILDLRSSTDSTAGLPGAIRVESDSVAQQHLSVAGGAAKVMVYDDAGSLQVTPPGWPPDLDYRYLVGGLQAWKTDVMTPAEPTGYGTAEREFIAWQNQIAAFFSGAAVRPSAVAAPPIVAGGPAKKKKKSMGC